jgi:tRNA-uridine 2-sulfurtransferase
MFPEKVWNGKSEEEDVISEICRPFVFHKYLGKVIGDHQGAHYYTIGQRKGLGVGGHQNPLFIVETNAEENLVYVGEGESHPALHRNGLFIPKKEVHWVRPDLALNDGESVDYHVRIRYRQPLVKARLICKSNGIYILFSESQKGIARGQFAAWYLDEELIGSGVIS